MKFITATKEYNTFEKHVSAPYVRKSFTSEKAQTATLKIAVCGFYELYFNGQKITKGFLAPYISNTDHTVYCDQYQVSLQKGENVIGVILGNGFQNNPGGWVWEFEKGSFRSAPKFWLELVGDGVEIFSDTTFKTCPSPIVYDDYRYGSWYDANLEIPDWNKPGFCDSDWDNMLLAQAPKGELRSAEIEPVLKDFELSAVDIFSEDDGFVYDFGVCHAGVCRLKIDAKKGQKITLIHGEVLEDGRFSVSNLCCDKNRTEFDLKFIHKDVYVCKDGKQEYLPKFVYHGFRYVKVLGITKEQATTDLLKFVVMHSALKTKGDFECSDKTVNLLQEMTRRSDISNFHYFPTDCPQREKNGWTADIALSTEQMLLNFDAKRSLFEWQRNLIKAQNQHGAVPCVVPTADWGYGWGSGPAWDCALVWVPYYIYMYSGEKEIIEESAEAILKYLKFLQTKKDQNGLVHFGLGDWCHAGRPEDQPKAPLEVTDTAISMLIAKRAAFLFGQIGKTKESLYAENMSKEFKTAFREHLIDFERMTVLGDCQTSQAIAIYYDLFEPCEKQQAFEQFLKLVHMADDHIDCGVLGGRIIFHLLSDYGCSDLAFKMITRKDFPSYAYWIERGATALWEVFDQTKIKSCNHHFWGDISAWFIKCLAGINYNPNADDIKYLEIKPCFVTALENASGYYITPFGKVSVLWRRQNDDILLKLEIPKEINAKLLITDYTLNEKECDWVTSGEYILKKK